MKILLSTLIGLVLILVAADVFVNGKSGGYKVRNMKNYRKTLEMSRYMLHALGGMKGTDFLHSADN